MTKLQILFTQYKHLIKSHLVIFVVVMYIGFVLSIVGSMSVIYVVNALPSLVNIVLGTVLVISVAYLILVDIKKEIK